MRISLKKQIHDKKISNIIKIHDFVLFFAIFGLPQKKRQSLKIQVSSSLLNQEGNQNAESKNNLSREVSNQGLTILLDQLYISNKCAKQVLERFIFETSLQKQYGEQRLLRASQKQGIVLGNLKNVPLSGQTLLIACRGEEQAKEVYKYTTSLYNTSLLGGFYKKTCKTREFLKALLEATSNKVEIYKEFLRVLSISNYKLVHTTATPNRKLLVLLSSVKKLPIIPVLPSTKQNK